MANAYSIIESFGRQFWVEPKKFQDFYNFKLTNFSSNLKKLKKQYSHQPELAKTLLFDRVLLYKNEKNIHLGKPLLNDFRVQASLLPIQGKQSKVVVFKRRAKKAYKKTIGHTRSSRRIRFENILKIKSLKNRQNLQILIKN